MPLHSSKALPYFEFYLQAVPSLENTKPMSFQEDGTLSLWFNALNFLDFSRALKALRTASSLLCHENLRLSENASL